MSRGPLPVKHRPPRPATRPATQPPPAGPEEWEGGAGVVPRSVSKGQHSRCGKSRCGPCGPGGPRTRAGAGGDAAPRCGGCLEPAPLETPPPARPAPRRPLAGSARHSGGGAPAGGSPAPGRLSHHHQPRSPGRGWLGPFPKGRLEVSPSARRSPVGVSAPH